MKIFDNIRWNWFPRDSGNWYPRFGWESGMEYSTQHIASEWSINQGSILDPNPEAQYELAARHAWCDRILLATESLPSALRAEHPDWTEDQIRSEADRWRVYYYRRFRSMLPRAQLWQVNQRRVFAVDTGHRYSDGICPTVYRSADMTVADWWDNVKKEFAQIDPSQGAPLGLTTSPRHFAGADPGTLMPVAEFRQMLELAAFSPDRPALDFCALWDSENYQNRGTLEEFQEYFIEGIKPVADAIRYPQGLPYPPPVDPVEPVDVPGLFDSWSLQDGVTNTSGQIVRITGIKGHHMDARDPARPPLFVPESDAGGTGHAMDMTGRSGLECPEAATGTLPFWVVCSHKRTGPGNGPLFDSIVPEDPRAYVEQRGDGWTRFYNGGGLTQAFQWLQGVWEFTAIKVTDRGTKILYNGLERYELSGAGRYAQPTGFRWGERSTGNTPIPGLLDELHIIHGHSDERYIRGLLAEMIRRRLGNGIDPDPEPV